MVYLVGEIEPRMGANLREIFLDDSGDKIERLKVVDLRKPPKSFMGFWFHVEGVAAILWEILKMMSICGW